MGQTIQADRTHPAVPLSLYVGRDGGIAGLTIEAKIFDGADVTQWLDFDDGVFKSAGHVDDTLALPEVDATEAPGLYAVDGGFDLSAITVPASTLSLFVHYAITAGGESGNDVDTIQFQDRVVDLVWDEVNRGADHNIKDSTGKQQRQASGGFESQDVVSATATTIELDASESAVDDFLIHRYIAITDGLGAGQLRVVSAYNGTTKVATVSRAWDVIPDATSDYLVLLSSEALAAGLTGPQAIQLQETWTSLGLNLAAPATFDFPGLLVQALANVTPINIVISVVGSAVTLTRQP
jgi:hypothetical protein